MLFNCRTAENKLGEVNILADHRHFEYLIFQRFNLFYERYRTHLRPVNPKRNKEK